MTTENLKTHDQFDGGLMANTGTGEHAKATGQYVVECFDKDGNLKWSEKTHNLVVNVGLQYMAGVALTSTTQITS